jgi:hypothetical protein
MQISPLDGWLVYTLSFPSKENGTIPLLTTITSMLLQNKQASGPPDVYITMQPPSKITVCKIPIVKCLNTNLWNKKNKKSGIGHQIFKNKKTYFSTACCTSLVTIMVSINFLRNRTKRHPVTVDNLSAKMSRVCACLSHNQGRERNSRYLCQVV